MELLVIIILFFFGSAILRGISAAGKSVVTGKSFTESYTGIPEFGLRIKKQKVSDEPGSPDIVGIEMRGPIPATGNLACMISIRDVTDPDDPRMVISLLDFLQEPESIVFQSYQELGIISTGDGLTDWARIGGFFPEMLQPAYSGLTKLEIIVLLVDANSPPSITYGVLLDRSGVYWVESLDYEYNFEEKGYKEAAEHREEAQALTVKTGVAVAMADGSLDDSEGMVIKNWIKKTITGYSDEKRKELKRSYNQAFKNAFAEAERGELSLSDISNRLNEIGEKKLKYDAYELANEVMAADGEADPEELKVIRILGEALELDIEQLEQIRSKHIVNLEDAFSSGNSLEELLGIDENWSKDKIKGYLAMEFQKWNGRYNSLEEGPERENAQNILNRIGEARKKYNVS